MPLESERIEFEKERKRLYGEMEETAEELATIQDQAAEGNDVAREKAQRLKSEGNQLRNYRDILDWANNEWDVGGVTLCGLTAGEVNRTEDFVENHDTVRPRDAWVASGTVDAPYSRHNVESVDMDDFADTVMQICDLPLAYVQWAESRISELSHLGDTQGNEFGDLVAEKRDNPT